MSFTFRRYFITGVVCLAILGSALLGNSVRTTLASSSHATHASQHAKALTDVHFILNWIPNVEFAGLWVAQHFGWWKAAGLSMSYTPYSISVHPETDVATRGGNTFGFQSGAALVIARSQGVPDRALYTDTQRSVFGLSVLASSKIHKITDLRGKRVGYQAHEGYVPDTMLAYDGLKPSDWKPVIVGYNTDQLTSGAVDAYLVFLNNEPIELALAGVKTRSFAASKYGFHAYDDVMFTTDKEIGTNPNLVRKVTKIVARGFAWAHTHHLGAVRITIHAPNVAQYKLSQRQQVAELNAFNQFSRDSRGKFTGRMTAATWKGTVKTLLHYGEIKHSVKSGALFTNRFNPYKKM
ncbi:MAG: ABC transporter substrate-binding protein [Chloroflexota bacterium]